MTEEDEIHETVIRVTTTFIETESIPCHHYASPALLSLLPSKLTVSASESSASENGEP